MYDKKRNAFVNKYGETRNENVELPYIYEDGMDEETRYNENESKLEAERQSDERIGERRESFEHDQFQLTKEGYSRPKPALFSNQ